MIATAPESDELSQGTSEVPSTDMAMVLTPDEKLVVAGRGQVLKLLPTGRLDPSFGRNGRIEIAAEPGTAFRLGGVAVDSLGRVLIAGTSESLTVNSTPAPAGFENALGPRPQLAAVYRYLPNGSPDPSFGQGGVVMTTFSLPRPTGPGPYDASYSTAAVGATGIVVDANDNPIVAGFFVRHVGACYTGIPMIYIGQAYVARLTSAGSLDSSFGQRGLISDPQMEYPATLSRGPGDELAYYGPRSTHCLRGSEPGSSLVRLNGDGSFDQGFATEGRLTQPNLAVSALTFDREDGMVLFGRRSAEQGLLTVRQLEADGSRDPGFGRAGSVRPRIPTGTEAGDVAVDRRGRILLAGTNRRAGYDAGFVVTRLNSSGKMERGFGMKGRRITGFGSKNATARRLAVDGRGRIVVGGTVRSPRFATGYGYAFARYLAGR